MAKWYFYALLLTFISSTCFALADDRQQVMQLSADYADINQQNHQGIYVGHVQVTQGSTHIEAAKASTETDAHHSLVKAIIQGNAQQQAHYWVIPAVDKPPVHAYADTMYYYPQKHLIELVGHVKIVQGNDSFSAATLSYDTLKQRILSKYNAHQQTMIIIHPGKNYE